MTLLNIFTGAEFLFFILGILATLSTIGLILLAKQYKLDWKSLTLYILGVFFLIFSIAWSVSSIQEGEPRAASMGMVFFGIPSLILITVGYRLMIKASNKA